MKQEPRPRPANRQGINATPCSEEKKISLRCSNATIAGRDIQRLARRAQLDHNTLIHMKNFL
jgi:hypothetical protein